MLFSQKIRLTIILLFLTGLVFLAGIFFLFWKDKGAPIVKAGTTDNVSGWAWSDNIGWISFACNNPEVSECATSSYGVNIKNDGSFEGYAWSENIGWISFNRKACNDVSDNAGEACTTDGDCPNGACVVSAGDPPGEPYQTGVPYLAKVDLNTGKVSGWARALAPVGNANAGGWDGWIKMSCWGAECSSSNYAVNVDLTKYPHQFLGWAWGSEVVGWISFNCSNPEDNVDCQTSNYKVFTLLNFPPVVKNLNITEQTYCGVGEGQGLVWFEWVYDDPDGDRESGFDFQVDDDPNFRSPEVDRYVSAFVNPGEKNTQYVYVVSSSQNDKIQFGKTYYWRVRVYDAQNNVSEWAFDPNKATTTADHAYPYPQFTHSPPSPSKDEVVTFTETSICYNGGEGLCQDKSSGIFYAWDFNYIPSEGFTIDSTASSTATTTYSSIGLYTVMLRITDSSLIREGTCSTSTSVIIMPPLPEWKEIKP